MDPDASLGVPNSSACSGPGASFAKLAMPWKIGGNANAPTAQTATITPSLLATFANEAPSAFAWRVVGNLKAGRSWCAGRQANGGLCVFVRGLCAAGTIVTRLQAVHETAPPPGRGQYSMRIPQFLHATAGIARISNQFTQLPPLT
jgi:hypothetical protein